MKAVILAAGIASRLRPLTNDIPKCLLQVGRSCLMQRTIEALLKNNITEIAIVTGYRSKQIVDYVTAHFPAVRFTFIPNECYDTTNNIYSLWLSRPFSEGEDVLLLDSDILFDSRIIRRLLDSDKKDILAVNSHQLGEEEIKVVVDEKGKVLEISKVCSITQAVGESVGIERMSRSYTAALFKELEKMILEENLGNVFYERAFERLIPQGYSFYIQNTTDLFSIELDTVDDFKQAQHLIPSELL